MNTYSTTADPKRIARWLEKAQQSAERAITTTGRYFPPAGQLAMKQEVIDIQTTIQELEQGGIQTDLETSKKK